MIRRILIRSFINSYEHGGGVDAIIIIVVRPSLVSRLFEVLSPFSLLIIIISYIRILI
jgi:hypothetical protein